MSKGRRLSITKILNRINKEEEKSLDPNEWLLAVLYASPSKSIPSEVHLQKALFLASRYIKKLQEHIEFKLYRMGPWSEEVKDSLEILEVHNLINRSINGSLMLSKKGLEEASNVWKKLTVREREALKHIVSFINKLSTDELLLYVYIVHGYKEKSDIIDKLLRRRLSLAISMLKKEAISVELAAKIAGLSLIDFLKILRKKNIKPYIVEVSDIEFAGKL